MSLLLAVEILLAAGIFAVVFGAMAIGVILRRKPIQGSCGGLGSLRDADGKSFCEACTEPCADLRRELREQGLSEEEIDECIAPSPDCETAATTTTGEAGRSRR